VTRAGTNDIESFYDVERLIRRSTRQSEQRYR